MGSSNATHVRLLNASADTEGVFACEISTENLSTVRAERELRLFGEYRDFGGPSKHANANTNKRPLTTTAPVLPRERLAVAGLREQYALGDHVELRCQADWARPRPTLAWFVNGLRVSTGRRRAGGDT